MKRERIHPSYILLILFYSAQRSFNNFSPFVMLVAAINIRYGNFSLGKLLRNRREAISVYVTPPT